MKRCMFVDNSSVIRKVAKRILGGPDMVVIEAATGLDAVEMCAADMPDIIVVDGALPDMQAVDVIRQRPRHGEPDQAADPDLAGRGRYRLDHAGQARRRPGLSLEAVQPAATARTLSHLEGRRLIRLNASTKTDSKKPGLSRVFCIEFNQMVSLRR